MLTILSIGILSFQKGYAGAVSDLVVPVDWSRFSNIENPSPELLVSSRLAANAARYSLRWAGTFYETSESGDRYLIRQSSLWSAQLARAAWMLWDELDAKTREQVVRLVVHEAGRTFRVRYWNGKGGDSKAEENSWDSMILQVAVAMMPKHPDAGEWKRKCSALLVGSYCRSSDMKREDFTLATKRFESPPFKAPGGTMFIPGSPEQYYPKGTDWSKYRYACYYGMDALFDVLGYDEAIGKKASEWRLLRAERMLEMQSRHEDGRLYAPGEYETYKGVEQMVFWMIADAHLLQWLADRGETFERKNWLEE